MEYTIIHFCMSRWTCHSEQDRKSLNSTHVYRPWKFKSTFSDSELNVWLYLQVKSTKQVPEAQCVNESLTDRIQRAVGITEVQMRQRVRTGQKFEEKLQDKHTHTQCIHTSITTWGRIFIVFDTICILFSLFWGINLKTEWFVAKVLFVD